jgi:hypothetical protein
MEKNFKILLLAACASCILLSAAISLAVDIPEKFKDIPLYQGSTVQQALDMPKSSMLTASVKAKGDAIADFYRNAMTAKGWKVAFQAEQENVKIIHFQKDQQIFQVTIQTEKEGEAQTYNLLMTTE